MKIIKIKLIIPLLFIGLNYFAQTSIKALTNNLMDGDLLENADFSAKSICHLNPNDSIILSPYNSSFYKAEYKGMSGFVSFLYINETSDLKNLRKGSGEKIQKNKDSLYQVEQKKIYDERKNSLCPYMNKNVDEFDNSIHFEYNISSMGGSTDDVSILKYVNKNVVKYYLSIRILEKDIYRGKGVTLLFNSGVKIVRPTEKVDSDYSKGFYTNIFMPLTPADLNIFKANSSFKYKLYISTGQATYDKDLINCLVKIK